MNSSIQALRKIFLACTFPLYPVLDGISTEQLHWKPMPDSRSIGEIFRHLIRVDATVLTAFGYEPDSADPGDKADAAAILGASRRIHDQITGILSELSSEEGLNRPSNKPILAGHDTLGEWVGHLSQHYLYHLAQVTYLRRAQDRSWESPYKGWESATYVISDNLGCMKGIVERREGLQE
jgi:uncharacterized damage-inducible protein DinB